MQVNCCCCCFTALQFIILWTSRKSLFLCCMLFELGSDSMVQVSKHRQDELASSDGHDKALRWGRDERQTSSLLIKWGEKSGLHLFSIQLPEASDHLTSPSVRNTANYLKKDEICSRGLSGDNTITNFSPWCFNRSDHVTQRWMVRT